MLTEYTVKNCKCFHKATLSGPDINLRLGAGCKFQNLLDVLNTVNEHAATMLKVEETVPK